MEGGYKKEGMNNEMNGEKKGTEEVVVEIDPKGSCSDMVLRFLALGLTLVGAVLLGVNRQTKVVSLKIIPTMPPVSMPATAKWHHMSAFVFFVAANAIACSYAAISLILTLANRSGTKKKTTLSLLVFSLDLIMVALLFSAIGATGAVGVIGYEGNSHVQWEKVCNVFDKFCHQVAAAVLLSFGGSIAYLLLVLLAALNIHNKIN